MERGHDRFPPESSERKAWQDAFSTIVSYFPSRRWDTQEMLIETVIGVLGGLDLDPPPASPEPPRRRRRFFGFRR
jgi:hypothetical protein